MLTVSGPISNPSTLSSFGYHVAKITVDNAGLEDGNFCNISFEMKSEKSKDGIHYSYIMMADFPELKDNEDAKYFRAYCSKNFNQRYDDLKIDDSKRDGKSIAADLKDSIRVTSQSGVSK